MNPPAPLQSLRHALPLIAPSMLKCDFGNLHREVERLESAGAKLLHWDVMDGHFVPNLSYGALLIEKVRPLTSMLFDAHLMISDPGKYIDEYIAAGCQAVTFHIEAQADHAGLLRHLRQKNCTAGLAINPDTPLDRIEPLLDGCDLVLVMSVQPGFGGQAFQPKVLDKVRALRRLAGERLVVSIDGGIGLETISSAAAAGADLFVAGSAIFDAPDYRKAFSGLTELAAGSRPSTVAEKTAPRTQACTPR